MPFGAALRLSNDKRAYIHGSVSGGVVIQCLVSAAAVAVWVSLLRLPAQLAPAFGIAIAIAITYWLSARLFGGPRVDAS